MTSYLELYRDIIGGLKKWVHGSPSLERQGGVSVTEVEEVVKRFCFQDLRRTG